jgi:type IV pilus biogenesis protein PilP
MSSHQLLPVIALNIRNMVATTALAWGLFALQTSIAQTVPASTGSSSGNPVIKSVSTGAPISGSAGPQVNGSPIASSVAPTVSGSSNSKLPVDSTPVAPGATTPASAIQLIQAAQRNAAIYRAQAEEIKARDLLESSKHVTPVVATLQPAAPQPAPIPVRIEKKDEPKPMASLSAAEKKPMHARPPALVAIYGRDADLQASLRLSTGVIWDVRVGDELEDGFQVKSITPKKVVVTIDGESIALVPWVGKTGATEPALQPPAGAMVPPTFGEPRPETPRASLPSVSPSAPKSALGPIDAVRN